MMLMIPIAPRASVTRPTLPRKAFIASKIFPNVVHGADRVPFVEGIRVSIVESVIVRHDLMHCDLRGFMQGAVLGW